jgi:hypothetical protein
VEGVVIVGSILLAFGIDAWWDGLQERREEQQILRGLQEEFQGHEGDLADWVVTQENLVAHTTRFMNYLAADDAQLSLTALDSAAFYTAYAGTWDPGNSVLNAVISSGRLRLIRDTQLRSALAGWQAIVDETRDNQLMMREFSTQVLYSALASRGILLRGWNFRQGNPEWPTDPDGITRYERLKGDTELIDLVSTKNLWWAINDIDEAQDGAARILRLIESQLR